MDALPWAWPTNAISHRPNRRSGERSSQVLGSAVLRQPRECMTAGIEPGCPLAAGRGAIGSPHLVAPHRSGLIATIARSRRCPTGMSGMPLMRRLPVEPVCRKHQGLHRRANRLHLSGHPASMKRDGSRSSRDVRWGGGGCIVSQRARGAWTNGTVQAVKSRGLDTPTLVSRSRRC